MIDIQALKARFIDLAIRGKLVEQCPEEGTAADLLKEIEAEKAQLIRDKKLKKDKPLPPISEDEIPFEIPESWEWCRFGDVTDIVSARRVLQSDWQKHGIPFYRAREIGWLCDGLDVRNELFISESLYHELSSNEAPKYGDLMITAVGTLGKTYVVKSTDKFYYKDASVICLKHREYLYPKFLSFLFDSPFMKDQIKRKVSGTTVGTIPISVAKSYCFPLPPLFEQQRIVAKLESMLSVLNAAQDSLNHSRSLAQKVRGGILQLAIQGKLVEQRPEEGTAEELLKQIQAEKAQLIKDKKIKKDKPLPPIAEDEIPFEIPESWEWVRIGDVILEDKGGGTPDKGNADYWNGDIPWMSVKDFPKNGNPLVSDTRDHITSLGLANSSSNLIDTKAIVLCVRMALGKYAKLSKPVAINQDLRAIWLSNAISSEYFLNFYSTLTSTLEQSGKGTTVSGIKKEQLFNVPMPIPPLSEQQRIVARVEKIFSMLKVLERS